MPRPTSFPSPWPTARQQAFTLIELLITIGIILVLAGLGSAGYGAMIKRAQTATELSAGRQLLTAYHAYSADNNGSLIPGYQTVRPQATASNGTTISGAAAYRYTWRLAPYLNYDFHGALLVNEMKRRFPNPNLVSSQYEISISPSFGLNAYCLGGYTNGDYQTGLATRASQLGGASDIIVFASAGRALSGEVIEGNHQVTPPLAAGANWGTMKLDDPSRTGSIHFRHNDKAVVVHYGGHITLESAADLRDMRKWNTAAIAADDPNFPLPKYTD